MKKHLFLFASCSLMSMTAMAQNNTAFGNEALASNTDGYRNVAAGDSALGRNTIGYGNSALGHKALKNNISGTFNTAVGGFSLTKTSSGTENTAIGYKSQELTTGEANTSLGYRAFQEGSGHNIVAIGAKALLAGGGSYNVGVGYSAMEKAKGMNNVGLGGFALNALTSGQDNVALGYRAGSSLTIGIRNIAIGSQTSIGSNANYNIIMGYRTYAGTGSSNIIIGNNLALPAGSSNALNIGGVLFGSGIYSKAGNGYAVPANGKIGINVVSPQATLDVAGDAKISSHLTVGGNAGTPLFKVNTADNSLRMNGNVFAQEIKVKTDVWADYVFDDGYRLMDLGELSEFVQSNKHLPDVAPAAEVLVEGIDLAQMNVLLLKKVEELTLYIIAQDKRIRKLEETKDGR